MTNLALLVLCIGLGLVLRRSGRLPENAPQVLNAFITNVALPALIVRVLPEAAVTLQTLAVAAVPWALFGLGIIFFVTVGRYCGWRRDTVGALVLSGGLANTSFVGLPMIEAFYGAAYLPVGIVIDQLGTYLVLSTLGILAAVTFASHGQTPSALAIARRVAIFPPFQALCVAAVVAQTGMPEPFLGVLDRLASTLVPLALISVGFQLRLDEFKGQMQPLAAGLAFKLILGPALIAVPVLGVFALAGPVAEVAIFEAAMGPQIGGAIVAMQHGLNPRLVTLMVGVGIPLSLLTASAWFWIIST